MTKYKSIDLFAGIGGIRLGFERAFGDEINTVFVSEWDEYAQKTYKENFKDDFEIAGDITKINETDIPQFDICLEGFLAKHSVLREKDKGLMIIIKVFAEALCFLMLREFAKQTNQRLFFVRMSRD